VSLRRILRGLRTRRLVGRRDRWCIRVFLRGEADALGDSRVRIPKISTSNPGSVRVALGGALVQGASELDARVDAELAVRAAEMRFDGLLGHEQRLRGGAV
jgi:hypothetical protein